MPVITEHRDLQKRDGPEDQVDFVRGAADRSKELRRRIQTANGTWHSVEEHLCTVYPGQIHGDIDGSSRHEAYTATSCQAATQTFVLACD